MSKYSSLKEDHSAEQHAAWQETSPPLVVQVQLTLLPKREGQPAARPDSRGDFLETPQQERGSAEGRNRSWFLWTLEMAVVNSFLKRTVEEVWQYP